MAARPMRHTLTPTPALPDVDNPPLDDFWGSPGVLLPVVAAVAIVLELWKVAAAVSKREAEVVEVQDVAALDL